MSDFQEKSIINVSQDKSRRRKSTPGLSTESDVDESFFTSVLEQSRLHDVSLSKKVLHTPQRNITPDGFDAASPGFWGTKCTREYDKDYQQYFRPPAHSSPIDHYTEADRYKDFTQGVKTTSSRKEESIIEWFDKSMESELAKRRPDSRYLDFQTRSPGIAHTLVLEATASRTEIEAGLRGEPDTDFLMAADKLSIAEAIVDFEGAVRAAEKAAATAPPEFAEEAAVAGARGFQAELTSCIREKIPGVKPIEVLGYVGITRPTLARKTAK